MESRTDRSSFLDLTADEFSNLIHALQEGVGSFLSLDSLSGVRLPRRRKEILTLLRGSRASLSILLSDPSFMLAESEYQIDTGVIVEPEELVDPQYVECLGRELDMIHPAIVHLADSNYNEINQNVLNPAGISADLTRKIGHVEVYLEEDRHQMKRVLAS